MPEDPYPLALWITQASWLGKIVLALYFHEGKSSNQDVQLDSGAHFYDTYETKDNRYMAVGAIEPQFYSELIRLLELDPEEVIQFGAPDDLKKIIGARFKEKTMEEWCEIFDGKDACVTPVLTRDEAPFHPHNRVRSSFIKSEKEHFEPRPAPLLMRTPGIVKEGVPTPYYGEHTSEILAELGYSKADVELMLKDKVAKQATILSKF
ncbi:hypothetical protein SK128_011149 [Halocaridina rubra]|uniref:Alpha-methylacyl-CoA racemase n=1 Tax=Halocaridina rubra TaxID=373956 RepID=A0AAN8XAR2_HALRR